MYRNPNSSPLLVGEIVLAAVMIPVLVVALVVTFGFVLAFGIRDAVKEFIRR